MRPRAQPAAAGAAPANGAQEGGGGGFNMGSIARMALLYGGMQLVIRQFGPKDSAGNPQNKFSKHLQPVKPGDLADDSDSSGVQTAPGAKPPPAQPLWPAGSVLDVHVRLSEAADASSVDFADVSLPSVTWEGLDYAHTDAGKWERTWDTVWTVPTTVQHNGSMYAHLFFVPTGQMPGASQGEVLTHHVSKPLTRYHRQRRVRETHNLVSGKKAEEPAPEKVEEPELPIISYYHPNMTFGFVTDAKAVPVGGLPPVLVEHVHLAPASSPVSGEQSAPSMYFPVVWPNEFWDLEDHMYPVNETTTQLPFRLTLYPTSWFKFQIMTAMTDSFAKQAEQGGAGGGELDVLKRTLLDSNPYLLVITAIISVLHMVFETLAFTSDVKHWRSKKEMVGVSVRTILTNVFIGLVTLLYLIDQSENTSWMILGGQGVGLLIEAWKITKAVDISIEQDRSRVFPYRLKITDKHTPTEDELRTREYDALAFKWVAWGTSPFVVGYTVYSLLYNEHRGWYSFTLETITSFVYLFGFVQLVPQLIINWKLKSVAHIPMKAMTYKFLNTIVDDVFSFAIKMPLLHRIACFRDDVVFVILIYQMYIYKVDPTRENEYGQKLAPEEAEKVLKERTEEEERAKAEKIEPKKKR